MARYDDENYGTPNRMNQQRDLVLSINEFCFLQNKTDGTIKTHVGPLTNTIYGQESLVTFNSRSKKFEETSNFDVAKQLFVSAPEGWYIVLKNPTTDNHYPEVGKPNISPKTIKIGTKINIPGPISFALYPGQMAKAVRGHKLRSNQYLLARVYDADAANKNIAEATIVNAEGKEVIKNANYVVGQLLVIKGTEVSFYIPPTGIEVIPQTAYGDDYVRDAVTLERLEYAILKDEDGEKRYVHGPAVVFPKPTETFVTAPKGGTIFRALELSPISGIYVKVIADYKDKEGKLHPTGEELFITGNDQMIYYPRPEHAMIQYDGKYMHHAIAIPEGEGRYILNRLTGEIKTVAGPQMYLPDPRTEVVVKRKLTAKECELIYPGNREVLAYNSEISEKAMEKLARRGGTNAVTDAINNAYSTSNQESALAIFEATSNISRGVSYTKPRTITLDTKYDGVVNVNVWTGYAVNVVSRTGEREIIVGPAARMLDYDETLEPVTLSTGKPKTADNLLTTAYLRVENNKVSDIIEAQTKDYVSVRIKVSYCVDFLPEFKDKWFSVDNYVKYLCDRQRSLLKREIKKYTIEEFYENATDIVRNITLDKPVCTCDGECETCNCDSEEKKYDGRLFKENGMLVHDTEVLSVMMDGDVARMMEAHQKEMITKCLELSDAERKMEVKTKLAEYERKQIDLVNANKLHKLELEKKAELAELAKEAKIAAEEKAMQQATKQAEADLQKVLDTIQAAELARNKKADEAAIETEKQLAEIEKARQEAYAATVKTIMESVDESLVAALTANANADMLAAVTKSVAPYAMAKGETVADFTNTLLRGTTLEGVVDSLTKMKVED